VTVTGKAAAADEAAADGDEAAADGAEAADEELADEPQPARAAAQAAVPRAAAMSRGVLTGGASSRKGGKGKRPPTPSA
jgi:hypothetical protein